MKYFSVIWSISIHTICCILNWFVGFYEWPNKQSSFGYRNIRTCIIICSYEEFAERYMEALRESQQSVETPVPVQPPPPAVIQPTPYIPRPRPRLNERQAASIIQRAWRRHIVRNSFWHSFDRLYNHTNFQEKYFLQWVL